MSVDYDLASISETDIAIVGMAARLPGAASVDAFWDNLRSGRSSITRLSDAPTSTAG